MAAPMAEEMVRILPGARRCDPGPPPQVSIPAGLELGEPPTADPARHDRLLAGRQADEAK